MRFGKTLLAVVGATAVLGTLAGSGSAGRLSVTSGIWRVTFAALEYSNTVNQTVCPVTLEGSFHARTTLKMANRLVGYVTRASSGFCSVGTDRFLTETLPWHLRYQSFAGTLPTRITSLMFDIVGLAVRTTGINGTNCLTLTTTTEPLRLRFTRETLTSVLLEAEADGEIRTEIGCFNIPGRLTGRSGSVQGSPTRMSVTLI